MQTRPLTVSHSVRQGGIEIQKELQARRLPRKGGLVCSIPPIVVSHFGVQLWASMQQQIQGLVVALERTSMNWSLPISVPHIHFLFRSPQQQVNSVEFSPVAGPVKRCSAKGILA